MIRLLSLVAILVTVPVFGKDDFRLQITSGNDPGQKIAQELVNRAQECWDQQNKDWFGAENVSLPNPCTVRITLLPTVNNSPNYGNGFGMTEFKQRIPGGYVLKDSTMTARGDRLRLLYDTIPHEVHHLVMATHLGKNATIPRWLDEGLASLCESDRYQEILERNLIQHLREGRCPKANMIFLATEYPGDVMPFYTASVSWCRYLMQRGGFPRVIQLIEGVQRGESYTSLFKEIYGWDSIQEAQNDWLAWVGDGSPKNTYTASQYSYDCYGRPLSCTTGDCYSQPMMVQPMPVQPQPMRPPAPTTPPVVVRPSPQPPAPEPAPEPNPQEPQTKLEPVKGDKGDRGERGEKGEKGDKGDRGERGEKGDDGLGVDKMFLDQKGNIHVAYTDGSDHTIGNVYDLRPEDDTTARQGETSSPRPAYFDIVPKGSN